MILPVYLYNGPEFGQRDEAVEAVIKALEKKFGESEQHIYYLNETSIGQVLSVLDNGNLFSSATCVICKNAELLKKRKILHLLMNGLNLFKVPVKNLRHSFLFLMKFL